MKFRRLAGAAAAASVIAVGTGALPAAATTAPYPPAPCAGSQGPGTVTSTIVTQGATVTFSACGFQSGTIIIILLDGKKLTTLISLLGGGIQVPVNLPWLGHHTISAVGMQAGSRVARARAGAFATPAGYMLAGATRTAAVTVDVVAAPKLASRAAAADLGRGGSDNGSMPLSDLEMGIVAASALAFAGGGAGLRAAARRRREAASGSTIDG